MNRAPHALNGMALAPISVMQQLHDHFGKNFQGAKVSLPNGAKVVMLHDPFTPDPKTIIIETDDCKGPQKVGTFEVPWKDVRVVSTSDIYSKIGIQRSHQVTSLLKNFKEVTPIREHLNMIAGVTRFELEPMRKALKLYKRIKIRETILKNIEQNNEELENWDRTPDGIDNVRQRAERLLIAGVDPKKHPDLQNLAYRMAHWLANDLERGVPVLGDMGMIATSPACPLDSIILAKKVWRSLGRPGKVWGIRYPVNQPTEVVKLQVCLAGEPDKAYPDLPNIPFVSPGPFDMIVVNQNTLALMNADCDGDLMMIEPADGAFGVNFQFTEEDPCVMPKKKGRTARHPFEEASKARDASGLIGWVCNLLTLLRAITTCQKLRGVADIMIPIFIQQFKVLYHVVIQCTKNMDADANGPIRNLLSVLKDADLPTKAPWSYEGPSGERSKPSRTTEGWKLRLAFYRSIPKIWEKSLHGWLARQMGTLKWFVRDEPNLIDKASLNANAVSNEYFEQTPEDTLEGEILACRLKETFIADCEANTTQQAEEDIFAAIEGRPRRLLELDFAQTKQVHANICNSNITPVGAREYAGVRIMQEWIASPTSGSWNVDTILTIDMLAKLYRSKPIEGYAKNRVYEYAILHNQEA